MKLPNYLYECVGIYPLNNSYIDTGIYPSDNLTVNALFGLDRTKNIYCFGARNTNSNTSAGQFAFYSALNTTSYWCYGSNRASISSKTNITNGGNYSYIWNDKNYMELYRAGDSLVYTASSSTTTSFTGTRTIHIFGLNNAGTNNWGQCWFYGMKLNDNGNIHNLIPCLNVTTNKYGVYDTFNENFIPLENAQELYMVSLGTNGNGKVAYETMFGRSNKTPFFAYNISTGYEGFGGEGQVKLIAEEDQGYVFVNWTDNNSNILSTEKEFYFQPTSNTTVYANFRKKTEDDYKLSFQSMSLLYGAGEFATGQSGGFIVPSLRNDIYSEVLSASIKLDTLQKATSTFELKDVPSTMSINTPFFVFSPKGKCVYIGIINKIDGNIITCREPLSIYDEDFVMLKNDNFFVTATGKNREVSYSSPMEIRTNLISYLAKATYGEYAANINSIQQEPLGARKHNNISLSYSYIPKLEYPFKYIPTRMTVTESSVANLEDYIIEQCSNYGIVVKPELIVKEDVYSATPESIYYRRHLLNMKFLYIVDFDEITISNNLEAIHNVEITYSDEESTVLVVFNSTGTTLKGFYTIDNSNNVVSYTYIPNVYPNVYPLKDTVGFNNYKVKIVLSDDKIDTLIYNYLSNYSYNHKITFDLDLDNSLLSFETLELGLRVRFYYGDKLYNSVITGLEYDVSKNDNKVHTVKVTLGNVRTNLTSKLNLGKVKK